MAPERDVNIRIRARDQASREVKKAKNSLQDLDSSIKGVRDRLPLLAGAVAGLGAAWLGLARSISDVVTTFGKFEFRIKSIELLLQKQGQATQANVQAIRDQARAITQSSIATEEQVLAAVSLGLSLGATREQSIRLARASTDLAAALGTDVETATRQLGRTLGGYAGELGEVIPELKNFTSEQLQAGAALDLIDQKFGGFGETLADTVQGSLNNLNSAMEQLKTALGDVLTESVGFTDGINSLASSISNLASTVERNKGALADLLPAGLGQLLPAGAGALLSAPRAIGRATAEEDPRDVFRSAISGGDLNQLGIEARLASNAFGDVIPVVITDLSQSTQRLLADAQAQAIRETTIDVGPFPESQGPSRGGTPFALGSAAAGNGEGFTFGQLPDYGDLEKQLDDAGKEAEQLRDTTREIGAAALAAGASDAFISIFLEGADAAEVLESAIKNIIKQLAAAVVQALVFKAIIGGATGGAGLLFATGGTVPRVRKAATGMVAGPDRAVDSVPALLAPGEVVVTRAQAERVFGGAANNLSQPTLNFAPTIVAPESQARALLSEVNDLIERRGYRLVASEVR